MEEKINEIKKKITSSIQNSINVFKKVHGLKETPTIPNYQINKKIQKKLLKTYSKENHKNSNSISKIDEISVEEGKNAIMKKRIFPWGIVEVTYTIEKNKIISTRVDYKDLKENYIKNMKNNEDKELIQFIENSFLLHNNKNQILRKLVKKPFSLSIVEEKLYLWHYYVRNSTREENALLMRKLLYYIGKFSEKIFKEFIKVKEISAALFIFLSNGKLDKSNNNINMLNDHFFTISTVLGYDYDGNLKEEEEPFYREEMRAIGIWRNKLLNIEKELNGTGYGFVFLKELKEIFDIYNNTSDILGAIFKKCFIFMKDFESFVFYYSNFRRILWNFFVNYFIDDPFVMNFMIELNYIFGAYKQHDMVKFLYDLVSYKLNTFDILNKLKNELEKSLGPEEIFDEKEKVQKMNNIDDVLKYIEGDEKPKKKKKKKKKKNENKINNIDQIKDDNNNNSIDNCDDIDNSDAISIISVADSVLDAFKNDVINETEFNNGNKIIPQLSYEFLNQFH